MNSISNDQQKFNISAKRDLKAFKELQSFSVYINLFSQTEINGMTRSVFKIIVEDNISHHKYIGYSLEKNKNNIDIFVNYVLSNLEMRGGLDKNYKLLTGRNLISHEDQQPSDSGKIKKAKVIKDNLSHKDILGKIYKELIFNEGYAEIEGYTETKNPILPPLFVDSFIRDFDKITKLTDYWRNQKINENDNKILKDTLSEAAHEVEMYQDNFDFDKALKFYKRLNIAAAELADSEKLSAQFLLKQVKIYFHLEQYDKCKEMIETNLKKYEDIKLNDEVGEIYFYLGMMSSYSNKTNEAEAYFSRSTRLLMKSLDFEKKLVYYNSRIRRLILIKDFDRAIALSNEAIRFAAKYEKTSIMAYLYGLKAEIYIRYNKYDLALETLDIQLVQSQECRDTLSESKCILQMFSVRSYLNMLEDDKAQELLKRVKKLSGIIKKSSYYYDALISLAIHFYKKNKNSEAEIYFKKALSVYKEKTTDAASHIVNMIYLSIIRIQNKNYFGAVILLNKMLRLCNKRNVKVYPAYIYNSLGRAYFEQSKFKSSNLHFAKSVKIIGNDKINDTILKANSLSYLGLNNISLNKHKVAENHLKRSLVLYIKHNASAKDAVVSERIEFIRSKIAEIK